MRWPTLRPDPADSLQLVRYVNDVLALARTSDHFPWFAIAVISAVMLAVGVIVYAVALRPRDDAGMLNMTVRTLGISLLIVAVLIGVGIRRR